MQKNKTVGNLTCSLTQHPLYLDSLFVPTQQIHLEFILNSAAQDQIQETVIIPCPNDEISLFQIQASFQSKIPQAHVSPNMFLDQVQRNEQRKLDCKQKASLKQLKMQTGRKKQSTLKLTQKAQPYIQSKQIGRRFKLSENRQKYEICLINLLVKSDVFSVRFQWSESINIKKLIISQINQWYQSELNQKDVQFCRLEIRLCPNKQIISFRFKKTKIIQSKQQMSQLIFSHQAEAIYIGFDINTNAFKYRKPIRMLTEQNTINTKILTDNLRTNPMNAKLLNSIEIQKILVIQFEDRTDMRLDYNQLKDYKIKYLLGILRVPNHDRKGLLVFNKIYLPDQQVCAFQFEFSNGKGINFVMAIVTSQKKLFMSIIDKQSPLDQKQITQLPLKNIQLGNNKCTCLKAYFNQAVCSLDNNQKFQYVCQIICDYIQKYFIEIQSFQTIVWSRYIKNMIAEFKSLPLYRKQVFRVVGYECSVQQGDQIQFKNFLVTTRTEQKAQTVEIKSKQKKTFFKIMSKSGRSAERLSEFKLDEVIFLPYTYFIIRRKKILQNIIEIEMEEIQSREQQYKSNLLVWVDDKQDQGKKIFKKITELSIKYPIILLQLGSNGQFQQALIKYETLFQNKNMRKIVITNMTRSENLKNGKLNQIAGVQTLRLVKKQVKNPNTEVIFYIGNLKATMQKLTDNGFNPSMCRIEVQTAKLISTLFKLCNWQDVHNFVEEVAIQQKLNLLIHSKIKSAGMNPGIKQVFKQKPIQKENPWGDMFSKLQI